jgi:hypothetical protein
LWSRYAVAVYNAADMAVQIEVWGTRCTPPALSALLFHLAWWRLNS